MDQWTLVLLVAVGLGLAMVFAGSRAQERARVNARLDRIAAERGLNR